MARKHVEQPDLRLVELPSGGDEAAVLVAVGVAEHHFLYRTAAVHEFPVFMQRQQTIHDAGAGLQIFDGLEQRDDVDRTATGGIDQPRLLQQQCELKHIGAALAHGDDALRDGVFAELGVGFDRRTEDREFVERLFAVFDKR